MSTSLLVLVPVALLFIVSGLCFVGCSLNTRGSEYDPDNPNPKPDPETKPPTKYSDKDVLADPSVVIAYWPLDEKTPLDDTKPLTAHDAAGANDGEYKHKGNAMGLYFPCPEIPGPPTSAPEDGFLSLGVESIVPGDTKQPGDDPKDPTTGMQVRGAFVTVPFNAALNPSVFTLEAWVKPEWDPAVPAIRTIVDSRDNIGGPIHGFVLWVNQAGNWEAAFGDANGGFLLATASKADLSQPSHVVLTFDGTNAVIYVNAVPTAPFQMAAAYSPNTTQDLVIGAGEPWLDDRMGGTGDQFFPLYPFNGVIQDVALYNIVLTPSMIETHYHHGKGEEWPAP